MVPNCPFYIRLQTKCISCERSWRQAHLLRPLHGHVTGTGFLVPGCAAGTTTLLVAVVGYHDGIRAHDQTSQASPSPSQQQKVASREGKATRRRRRRRRRRGTVKGECKEGIDGVVSMRRQDEGLVSPTGLRFLILPVCILCIDIIRACVCGQTRRSGVVSPLPVGRRHQLASRHGSASRDREEASYVVYLVVL